MNTNPRGEIRSTKAGERNRRRRWPVAARVAAGTQGNRLERILSVRIEPGYPQNR